MVVRSGLLVQGREHVVTPGQAEDVVREEGIPSPHLPRGGESDRGQDLGEMSPDQGLLPHGRGLVPDDQLIGLPVAEAVDAFPPALATTFLLEVTLDLELGVGGRGQI